MTNPSPSIRPCPQWSMDHCDCRALADCKRWASHDAVVQSADANPLSDLEAARQAVEKAVAHREALIQDAIEAGHSERAIGSAAGLTGVSIHNRKARR